MKTIFIPAKLKNQKLNREIETSLKKLPKNLLIAYSIQYKPLAEKIKDKLGKRTKGFKQILGCTKLKTEHPILLVSDGRFHALNLILQNNQVYIIGENSKIKEISDKEINKLRIQRKTALIKFLNAKNIGILVSTKPGQQNLKKALKLKKQLENKSCYIYIANNISSSEIENFPNIQSWVNTACPGLIYDNPNIININEIKL